MNDLDNIAGVSALLDCCLSSGGMHSGKDNARDCGSRAGLTAVPCASPIVLRAHTKGTSGLATHRKKPIVTGASRGSAGAVARHSRSRLRRRHLCPDRRTPEDAAAALAQSRAVGRPHCL